ncbi:hypothetical protein TNCT_299012, partial [Trichonephila clavata]
ELFNHPFLKPVPRSSSPVPVPSRRSVSPKATPSPVSPCGSPGPGWGGEEMAQTSSSLSPLNNSTLCSNSEQRYSPPSPIEQDFVVVPANLGEEAKYCDYEVNKNSPMKHQLSDPNLSPSKIPVTNKAFKKSTHHTNINLATKAVRYKQTVQMSSENEGACAMQISETVHTVDPVPVPTQKDAYEQIEHSLQNTPASSPLEGFDMSKKMVSPGTSPTTKETGAIPAERTRRPSSNSTGSDVFRFTDISSFTPPTVQFTIGTPPTGGRLRSFSGSTPPPGSGRQTPTGWRHQQTPPQNLSGSPLRRSGGIIPEADGLNYIQRSGSSGRLSENGLLMGHFALSGGGASQSPPLLAYNAQQQRYLYNQATCQHHCCCGTHGSPGRNRRNSFGGGMGLDSSPTCHLYSHGNSPSSLEGHFIPELPEETLLEPEHNDTLAKLNFVSALVKCILELAKTRSSPLSSALSSSISPND